MGMLIACSRGCGEMIEVTDEVLDEAKRHGSGINVAHEVCPTDPGAVQRRFKVYIVVDELQPPDRCASCRLPIQQDPDSDSDSNTWSHRGEADHEVVHPSMEADTLARVGATVDAGSFKQALPLLQDALGEQWAKVVGMADVVDSTYNGTQDGTQDGTPDSTQDGTPAQETP